MKPRHQHEDEVLRRWAAGQTASVIAAALPVPPDYVRVLVGRARRRGDDRATARKGSSQNMRLSIPRALACVLRVEAKRRDVHRNDLALRLLEIICRDNLFGAVLDD
jgi:hypothetical protein